MSPLGAAGSLGAGAAGAGAGGGGGGAGSSFLPHPPKVRVKAKRAAPDNKTILFPILNSPPFPSQKPFLLDFLLHKFTQSCKRFPHADTVGYLPRAHFSLAFGFSKTSAAGSTLDKIDTRLAPRLDQQRSNRRDR
jgi:hypothetical protein